MNNFFIVALCCCLTLSGCSQMFSQHQRSSSATLKPNLGQYYQWIKSLEAEQLNSEIILQQQRKADGIENAKLYLLMLHSLPSANIFNPYTAKSMLNDGAFNQYIYSTVSSEDLALITLLRDQLNQQLLLIQEHKQLIDKNNQVIAKTNLQLAMHQKAIAQLNQKIAQLKAIETQLSNREGQ
ncbi:hypothetical protein HII17_01410 [Thalassotalea sp. M1531]|uniref:Uncharacterized protein n=1 Tax=Thalassotalea algicola TaxID=2716224 RepID=A0A7Y0LBU2_9GAMM|nr:hypothetical protein [Thalassotalea algicola]NMP30205.1 hypothetical protein [Thalassotalea algicola]